jgi:hypothetical protein
LANTVAQVALHVVPFALLLAISNILCGTLECHWRNWIAVILASMLEPAFQVRSSLSDDRPSSAVAVMAASLFLFGVVELQLYRRFDFATMFVFRMLYYRYWHVIWGYLRLQWLCWLPRICFMNSGNQLAWQRSSAVCVRPYFRASQLGLRRDGLLFDFRP